FLPSGLIYGVLHLLQPYPRQAYVSSRSSLSRTYIFHRTFLRVEQLQSRVTDGICASDKLDRHHVPSGCGIHGEWVFRIYEYYKKTLNPALITRSISPSRNSSSLFAAIPACVSAASATRSAWLFTRTSNSSFR